MPQSATGAYVPFLSCVPISLNDFREVNSSGAVGAIAANGGLLASDLWILTDNTGGGSIEAGTFSVLTSWDNGAQVTDTATDSVPAVTSHKITATIAAGDIPDTASYVNIQLVLGTHANDPIHLLSARLNYFPRSTED